MRSGKRWRSLFSASLAAIAASFGPLPRAAAEEPKPGMGEGKTEPAQEGRKDAPTGKDAPKAPPKLLTDAEAAPHLERLKDAARSKKPDVALAALTAIAGVTHPAFEAALGKLLGHVEDDVAAKAAAALGERGDAKWGATLWKGFAHPANAKRYDVQGAVLAAMGAVKAPLDAKQYDEVESLWRRAMSVDSMNGVTTYFRLFAKDKRPCKTLAQWLDEPRAGNVNDGSNPPASYWQARWNLWSKTKPGVVAALEAITGQHFDATADAKAWFEANPKFGVRW